MQRYWLTARWCNSQVEHESPQIVRIIRDTLLKREPVQSVALPPRGPSGR